MFKSTLLLNFLLKNVFFLFNYDNIINVLKILIKGKRCLIVSELSIKLTNLREERGWSKTYVSKKLGLSNMQTYANYEYGSREPDLEILKNF